MKVTDDPPEVKLYTAAELLEMVLAAYERGLVDAHIHNSRNRWHGEPADRLREARRISETRAMKERAAARYRTYSYPDGYDYRGGPVNWETGLPQGSGCAWLRIRRRYELAGGGR